MSTNLFVYLLCNVSRQALPIMTLWMIKVSLWGHIYRVVPCVNADLCLRIGWTLDLWSCFISGLKAPTNSMTKFEMAILFSWLKILHCECDAVGHFSMDLCEIWWISTTKDDVSDKHRWWYFIDMAPLNSWTILAHLFIQNWIVSLLY